jgi:hypothetical protein
MSIARTEAEKRFPIPKDVSKNQKMTLFFNQSCYIEGRTADITDAEIDAVAAIDCADSTNGCCEFAGESEADKLLWRNHARTLLEAARKAVME